MSCHKAAVIDTNNDGGNEQKLRKDFREDDKGLENIFMQQLQNIIDSLMLKLEASEKLCKMEFPSGIVEIANRIPSQELCGAGTLLTDYAYAIRKVIKMKMGIMQKQKNNMSRKKTINWKETGNK